MKHRLPCSLLLIGTLAACQSAVRELDNAAPSANDFTSALAAEYQDYSNAQVQLGRKDAANFYAAKGLSALHGEKVPPDTIAAPINGEDKEHLTVARELLLSLLTDDLGHVNPQKTAHAQLLFDCWQDKASTNMQTLCDEEFAATSAELQALADTFHNRQEVSETVHFARRSAVLSNTDEHVLTELAGRAISLQANQRYTIELDTHAEQYHQPDGALAQARGQAVYNALIDAGVPAERITIKSGGEKAVLLSSDEEADGEQRGDVDMTLRTLSGGQP